MVVVFVAHNVNTHTNASPVQVLTPRGPAPNSPLPIEVHTLCTPIRPLPLVRFLHKYPDNRFTSTLIQGFTYGFALVTMVHAQPSTLQTCAPLWSTQTQLTKPFQKKSQKTDLQAHLHMHLTLTYVHPALGLFPKRTAPGVLLASYLSLICPRGQ